MQKAERRLLLTIQASPVRTYFFQQRKSAINICMNEIIGSANGAIDMALCREMHDGPRPAPVQQTSDERAVGNVSANKFIALVMRDSFQAAQISCVGEFVQGHNRIWIPFHPL